MRSKNLLRFAKLTILTLLALWVPAAFPETLSETGSGPVLVQDIAYKSAPDQTVIVIRASRKFDHTSYYPNPRLFILDIPEAQSQLEKNFVDIKTSLVDFATITQIGEGQKCLLRFEINLRQPIQYSLHNEGLTLKLILNSVDSSQAKKVEEKVRLDKAITDRSLKRDQTTASGTSEAQTLINDLTIEEDSQQLQFMLQTTTKPSFSHFELQAPARLVIDVSNSNFKISRRAVKLKSDLIQRIRFGYGDSGQGKLVRCVFDLAQKTPYKISGTDSALIILFSKQNNQAETTKKEVLTKPRNIPSMLDFPESFSTELSALETKPIASSTLAGMDRIAMPIPLAAPVAFTVSQGSLLSSQPWFDTREAEMNLRKDTLMVPSAILDLSKADVLEAGVQSLPQGSHDFWMAQLPNPALPLIMRASEPKSAPLVGEPTTLPLAKAEEPKPELAVRQHTPPVIKPQTSLVTQPSRLEPVPPAAQNSALRLQVPAVKTQKSKPAQPVGEPTAPLERAEEAKPELVVRQQTPPVIKAASPTVAPPTRLEPSPAAAQTLGLPSPVAPSHSSPPQRFLQLLPPR